MGGTISPMRRLFGMLILPLLSGLLMALSCFAAGTALFTGYSTTQLFIRGFAYVLLLSFGMSINMHTGRFDFSAGATMLIGGVVGAQVAVTTGSGPLGMLLTSILVGGVCGLLTGILYVTLRLSPMIIGLGMTLVLEGIVAIITDGCKPVGFGTDAAFYRFAVDPIPMLAVSLAAVVIMAFLFHYTPFGYDYRGLISGQKIAVDTGVKERQNAVICYLVAGLCFGAAGAISVCSTNGVTPTINFSSISAIFSCFLPLFFSGFIERYCNKQLAILLGCVAYELIQIGFGQISFAVAAFSADIYRVVEALILVLFLIYLNNRSLIHGLFRFRRDAAAKGVSA